MSNKLAIGLVITAGVSGAIKGIRSVCNSFKILQDQSLSTTKKMGALAKTGLAGLSTLASSATAVAGTIRGLAQPAIKFESAMADVRKVVDFDTPEQFKEMGNDILKLTRTIPMAGEEIAAIVAAGGQSGVARENLLGYAKDAATMGVAFDMAAGDAGTAMATMANVLGKPITEMAQFGDVINHLSDNANSKAADIVNVITRAGSDMRMLELTENQTAALGSTFLSMGKAPQLAAQAMKGMSSAFMQLKAGAHEKELKQLGFTTKSFAAAMNKDAQGAITTFIEKVKKMPKDKQYPLLAKIFGKQYADDVLLLAQNTEEYNRQLALLQETDENGNLKYIGSMQREFENRSNTTENKLIKLKSSLTEISAKIGEAFLPVITSFVDHITPVIYGITEWVATNPQIMEWVLTIGGGIGAVVGSLLALHSAFSFVCAGLLPFLKLGKFLGGFLGKFLFSAISKLSLGFGYLIGYVLKGAMMFGKAIVMMSRALLTNPIGLLITGIAVAAYLIYDNWGKIGPWFFGLWQTVSGAFSSAWAGITNFCSEAWAKISSFFTSGIGNITATILDWSPLGLFQQVFSTVLSWFGIEVPSKFSEFGKNMIDGLVNGIKNAWENAKRIVSELGEGIKGWFADKLGIRSPSRVFMGYGKNTVQGLAIGVAQTAALATTALGNIADNMQETMPKKIAGPAVDMATLAVDVATKTVDMRPKPIVQPINAVETAIPKAATKPKAFAVQPARQAVIPAPTIATITPPESVEQQDFLAELWGSVKGIGLSIGNWFKELNLGKTLRWGAQLLLDRPIDFSSLKPQARDFRISEFNPDVKPEPFEYQSLQQAYQDRQRENNTEIHDGITVHFNPTIQVNGNQPKEDMISDIQQGLNVSLSEFEQVLNRVLDQRQRRAF